MATSSTALGTPVLREERAGRQRRGVASESRRGRRPGARPAKEDDHHGRRPEALGRGWAGGPNSSVTNGSTCSRVIAVGGSASPAQPRIAPADGRRSSRWRAWPGSSVGRRGGVARTRAGRRARRGRMMGRLGGGRWHRSVAAERLTASQQERCRSPAAKLIRRACGFLSTKSSGSGVVGNARALGARDRGFESHLPDHIGLALRPISRHSPNTIPPCDPRCGQDRDGRLPCAL